MSALKYFFGVVARPQTWLDYVYLWLAFPLGLFYFVLNGLLLWGFAQIMPGYDVSGLWAGILGSLVIMIVNWVASLLFGGEKK